MFTGDVLLPHKLRATISSDLPYQKV